ncbi:cell division protein FtsQ/DivIB [Patescibacteria group bacterium]|nr:cell division protein FtsQ/DivIB [Patescibacteria group bacterium]
MARKNPRIRGHLSSNDEMMVVNIGKKKGGWRLWLLAFILLLVMGISVYLLFFSDFFRIKNIEIIGASDELRYQIREMAGWETDYMILFDENKFSEAIRERWNEFSRVEIDKNWPDNVTIQLFVQEPKVVWNSESVLYLLDEQGVVLGIVAEEERMDKYAELPVVGDLSGLPVQEGVKVVSHDFVEFVYGARDNIESSIGKEIEAYEVRETTFELRVRMKEGYEVYFDTLRPVEAQVEKLNIFLKNNILVNDYIDLRVPGEVYYI